MKKVIVITGPTAVGKTNLSVRLAKHFQGEVLNADASQFRKQLNIGTAKITDEEMDGVVHHLIDILDVNEPFSIKDYQEKARKLLDVIEVPFVVGGSGLYLQALLTDYQLEATQRNRDRFKDDSNESLYNQLLELDPVAASKIHPNNRRRVERYLELALEQGQVSSKEASPLYEVLYLCLVRDRESLYERINKRTFKMMNSGWIEEAKALKDDGVDLSNIKDIGYKEIGDYLNGDLSFDDVVSLIQQKTRNYAKRQLTWFRNKMSCTYFDVETGSFDDLIETIAGFLRK